MTKKKIIEDMIKHCGSISQDKKFVSMHYIGRIKGIGAMCNGFAMYLDKDMPEVKTKSTYELKENDVNNHFGDNLAYQLSGAIEIDKSLLDAWIKKHRRSFSHNDNRFVIGISEAFGNTAYIIVDAWYLRNQLEYVKNNRIFIMPDKFRYNYDDSVYIGAIYSFSDNFEDVKCLTLPINFQGGIIKPDLVIEGGIPKG